MLSFINTKSIAQNKPKSLVCYGKIDHNKIKGYNLLVLEESHYTKEEVDTLKSNNLKVIAYLSLAEINAHSKYYNYLKDYTLGKNSIWNSFHLDLTSLDLRNRLHVIIGEILEKGFDGLFLDNIDNVCNFGPNPNFKEYLIELLEEIRNRNEDIFLIQNSGLEIIEKTYMYVNMVALESVITNYNFETKTYGLRKKSETANRLSDLEVLIDKYTLKILLIEYANKSVLYNKTKKLLLKTGHDYFIGNINLQTIPKF
ncbi:endo alpha-1,4 polygalactosaminidase [Aureibaculum sp. A20]|uniref:Endo alpha-1,4 polygalactosaminidase n=1 Tax=Aureibaculum flavum TaxID=2795986 RepID=A0ABS0WQ28_9FLAO|nr:endo alpha-1,4 polygalactosaminidase [Aureibaculum flavum]MBJ2174086.1 endo alpha-1,4 polygalactosaminidase [Aureibaculum flavum]